MKEMKMIKWGVLGFLGLMVFGTVLGSFYSVDQGDRAVVTRFGKVVEITEPGLHWKTPWIESATMFSVRENKTHYVMSTYSRDQQPTDLKISINYMILPTDVEDIYTRYGTDYVNVIIAPTLPNLVKEVFGQFNAESMIQDRQKLVTKLEELVRTQISERNIHVVSIQVEDIEFEDEYEKNIRERMSAQVATLKAEADKVRHMTEADANAYEVTAAADANAHAIQVQGEAEATAIRARSAALRENRELVALVAAEKWNGVLPSTMLPGATVPFVSIPNK